MGLTDQIRLGAQIYRHFPGNVAGQPGSPGKFVGCHFPGYFPAEQPHFPGNFPGNAFPADQPNFLAGGGCGRLGPFC